MNSPIYGKGRERGGWEGPKRKEWGTDETKSRNGEMEM